MFEKVGYSTFSTVKYVNHYGDKYLMAWDDVKAGVRLWIMEFSSRLGIHVLSKVHINVKEKDKTVAGETIIGKIL